MFCNILLRSKIEEYRGTKRKICYLSIAHSGMVKPKNLSLFVLHKHQYNNKKHFFIFYKFRPKIVINLGISSKCGIWVFNRDLFRCSALLFMQLITLNQVINHF